jgi:4-nitrophenyl phosphatase
MHSFDFSTVKALFLDLDGVLWNGSEPIGDLKAIFQKITQAGVVPILGTNNSTRTPASYQKKMASFGVQIEQNQIISPAVGAAILFKEKLPANVKIHVFGSSALKEYLISAGFILSDESAEIVLVSLDQDMTYKKVETAKRLIDNGAVFYATNLDPVLASERGWLPGGGVMVNAVETCTQQKPIVIGKPEPLLIQIAQKQMGIKAAEMVAVGDRYDTDILGGIRAGCRTVMVLSGVDSQETIKIFDRQPDLVCQNLNEFADLLLQHKGN